MGCASCGAELLPGKRFCPACGAEVPLACPSCGAALGPQFRFCPDCGAAIASRPGPPPAPAADDRLARLSRHIPIGLAEKIRASKGTVAGERKLVTVLFCDLVGSTALAERLDPEEYRDLLDQYLEVAFREIYRFEGIINQLAGDGFMALFGAPVAHEDAPDRAVLAALAIRDALGHFGDTLRTQRGLELRARIGLHTGPVVVGTVGNDLKMDYTAIGDTTNLASRLQSVAEPGTILLSEATHRLVLGFFHVRPTGPLQIKGKSEPVAAYEVIGQRDSATPMGIAVARGLTPLAGRGEELAQLRACYQRLTGDLAQVVEVVGDDGSGKSRLLYEFRQQLTGEPVVFFEGRCSSLSQMIPYAPFTSMFRAHFGLAADEAGDSVCRKVSANVRAWDQDLDRIYPFLCRLLAAPVLGAAESPADEVKRDTLEAVARLVISISEQTPVVMIIEDIQWIDELSRELLDVAIARLRTARVMLVMTHRPDVEPSWRTPAAFTRLTLQRLSDDDTRGVVRALAGGSLPELLEERILVKAEGNPFFTEELTRALVEDGHILPAEGGVRLARPVAEILIPDTVQELIGARLDRLEAPAKRVAQVASVLGRQFKHEQLARLLDEDDIDVTAQLEELERRGIVHRKTVLSNDEFRFGESLTQEVAYESLLLKERRQLHGRMARMLEAAPGEATAERSALVAHHFARSDDQEMAVEALLRTARDAERVPSFHTAVELYRQAWDMAEATLASGKGPADRARRGALEATLGLSRLSVLYGFAVASDVDRAARRGRELAAALGDTEALAHLCSLHGMHTMGGDREQFARGLTMVEEALQVAQQAQLAAPTVSISRALALGYVLDGRFTAAVSKIDWVMRELERSGAREGLSDVYFGACFVWNAVRFYSDDFSGALEVAAHAYSLAAQAHNRTAQSGFAARLAHQHLIRGNYGAAREWADRSLPVAEEIANAAAILTAGAVTLIVRIELGETPGRYVALTEHALATGNHMLVNARLVVEALLAADEVQRAERVAELAYRRAGGRLREMLSASALADVMLRRGPTHWDIAAQWYGRAVALAEPLGARSALAVAMLGLADLAAVRGDQRSSADKLEQALGIFRDLGLGYYQGRGERLLAHLRTSASQHA
jgi:class 3 adenylate cyclase